MCVCVFVSMSEKLVDMSWKYAGDWQYVYICIFVKYVARNKFAIVVVHYCPFNKKNTNKKQTNNNNNNNNNKHIYVLLQVYEYER